MSEVMSGDVTVMVMARREAEWLAAFVEETVVAAVGDTISAELYSLAMDLNAWPDGFVTCSSCDVVAEYADEDWNDELGMCPSCVQKGFDR